MSTAGGISLAGSQRSPSTPATMTRAWYSMALPLPFAAVMPTTVPSSVEAGGGWGAEGEAAGADAGVDAGSDAGRRVDARRRAEAAAGAGAHAEAGAGAGADAASAGVDAGVDAGAAAGAGAVAIPRGSTAAPDRRQESEASARLGVGSARPVLIWERRDQRAICSSRVRGTSRETGQRAPCRRWRAARTAAAAAEGRRRRQRLRRPFLAARVTMQAIGTCTNKRGRQSATVQNSRKRAMGSARCAPSQHSRPITTMSAVLGEAARSSEGRFKMAAGARAGPGSAARSAIATRCRRFIRERVKRGKREGGVRARSQLRPGVGESVSVRERVCGGAAGYRCGAWMGGAGVQ